MLIEHSRPTGARMDPMPPTTVIRIWLDAERFVTIRAINNDTAIVIEHFQAPGGASYATALNLQPNSFNGIVIK